MSLNAKSNGTQKEIRLMPDITTPPFASEDGSSFYYDFLSVDLTSREVIKNRPSYFNFDSDQLKSGTVTNYPTGTDVNQPFIGYREVFPAHVSLDGRSHIVVKVTEFYPVLGREHYAFFNTTGWSAWKTVNNT